MEAALLASFLNTYMPKIWAEITKGNEKEKHLKHELDINKLGIEIGMMAATIEEYESSGMERGTAQSVWINTLRRLAQEIEDHIELFLHPGVSKSSDFECTTNHLMERLNQIKKDQRTLGAPATTSTSQVDQSVPDLPDYVVHEEEPLTELLGLVQEDEEIQEDAEKMKVITIVGFGGLGKTLRANQVYKSKVLGNQFDLREWFCAADMKADDILKLIRERLENGASSGSAGTDVQRIRTCLQEKRYLIVIDDMRDSVQWHRIKSAFPKKLSSRIIVTTTRESVAEVCSCSGGYVYRLLPLNRDDSINLLVNGLSLSDSEAEDVEDLLNKCDGLPLALINLSQYFQGNGGLTRQTCEAACRRLGVYLVGKEELGEIRQVLVKKYTGLCGHILKACLLYFSVFPWNNQTRRNYLIRRWVAEGFVSQDDAITKFKTLMERNVIQAMEVSSDGVGKRCQPPGMMLEYILYKATSEKFVTLFPAEGETNGFGSAGLTYARRICLNPNNLVDDDLRKSINLPIVRALEVSGKASKAILNFKEAYKLLRVLELKECATLTNKEVENICDHLLLLRYLSLGEKIDLIPRRIANLKLLETLQMRRTQAVIVPFELILLPSLTHLLGKFRFYDEHEYKNIPSTSQIKLERLSGFVAGEKGFPELVPRMKRLRKVKLWCNRTADGTLSEAIKKFIRGGLSTPKGDRSLSVDFSGCSNPFKDFDKYPGRLTSLKLKGKMMMERFPQFLELSGIEKLCLSSTELTWVLIEGGVGQFPRLFYLKLYEDDLHDLAPAPEDDAPKDAPSVERVKPFQKLQRICFSTKTLLPPPTILQRRHYLPAIKQVYLYSIQTLDEGSRCSWKGAARKHPQRPMVWFGAPPQASQ